MKFIPIWMTTIGKFMFLFCILGLLLNLSVSEKKLSIEALNQIFWLAIISLTFWVLGEASLLDWKE